MAPETTTTRTDSSNLTLVGMLDHPVNGYRSLVSVATAGGTGLALIGVFWVRRICRLT